jgi:hypothetical protein
MEKEFVPYTESLELKQLGFDEPCLSYYEGESFSYHLASIKGDDYIIPAPLYQQASRWFREKYDLFCYVELVGDRLFDYMIIGDFVEEEIDYEDGPFNTHEEAELACLKKLIEIVKTK